MSKRSRVPAPFQKFLPSITRGAIPRLVIIAGSCALLFFVGGGSYLITHSVNEPTQPTKQQPLLAQTPAAATALPSAVASNTNADQSASDSTAPPAGTVQSDGATSSAPTSASATVQEQAGPATKAVTKPVTDTIRNVLLLPQQLLGGL